MTTDAIPLPTTPRPRARGPLAGFGTVFMWGLHLTFTGKRFFIITALAFGMGAFFGMTFIANRSPYALTDKHHALWALMDESVCVYLLPLCALIFVTSAFSREVSQRTLVYHLVRPVSRATIYLARLASGLVPAIVVGCVMLAALAWTSGLELPAGIWIAFLVVAAVAGVLLGSLYYFLSAVFRRGVVAALIYTFVLERALGSARGAVQSLSMNYHVRSVFRALTNDYFADKSTAVEQAIDLDALPAGDMDSVAMTVLTLSTKPEYESLATALVATAIIVFAAAAIGVWKTKRRDFALKD